MPISAIHIEKLSLLFENEVVKRLIERITLKTTKPEKVIVEIRDTILYVPLILEGRIKVERRDGKGNGILLHYLEPYEICPISFFYGYTNQKSDIRCIADTDLQYLAIPIERAASWYQKFNSWRDYIAVLTQKQHAKLFQSFDDFVFHGLDFRLEQYLKYRFSKDRSDTIYIKHQDIALDLKVSRESVSRTLKVMEKTGKLVLGRGKIRAIKL